jgi:Amt family ammonium transporter
MVWSFIITFGIMLVLKKTIGVRVSPQDEADGLDYSQHAESAYH